LENPNPTVFLIQKLTRQETLTFCNTDQQDDPFDTLEIFDLIRNIKDPEHPVLTLEQLKVTQYEHIHLNNERNHIQVFFTPTVPHCSMATLIGLCIRVRLLNSLPERFKVDINVIPGSHASEDQVNRQLNDKERVAAALENPNIFQRVNQCIQEIDLKC